MATITLTVTVSNPGSGNKYYIDGVLQATVSMTPGNTYKFDQADNSNSGHPLRISTTSDGSHNSGSAYTTGVTTAGTPGSSGAYTQIEVTAITVQTLYYYCTQHSGMGGSISVGNASTKSLKELSGFNVQNKSSDPVPYAQALTDDPYAGTWASGGSLNQSRYSLAGAGTQTAGLVFGGYSAPSRRNETEEYNGTAWSEQNNLNMQRNELTGAGTQTAALAAGGYYTSATNDAETYNGTSWTEISNLSTARDGLGSTAVGAVNTAVIVIGGQPFNAAVERWNGSSWTEIAELNTNKELNASAGTVTSGITIGGKVSGPTISNQVESWNGSAWTEVTEINTARSRAGASGVSNTAALLYGGENGTSPDYTVNTESWDGSAWTEVNNMSTARYGLTGGGGAMPYSTALASGGYSTSSTGMANTEEWSFSGLPPSTPAVAYSDAIVGEIYYNSSTGQFKGIINGGAPLGSFSSGATLPTAKDYMRGIGIQTASLGVAGTTPPYGEANKTNSYNGTAWSELANLNLGRSDGTFAADGTQTGGIIAGGQLFPSPGANLGETETWNGSSWTEVNNLNTARDNLTSTSAGTTTASLAFMGGAPPPNTGRTESWNGTNWTEVNDLNTARERGSGGGSQTAAIAIDGAQAPAPANPDGVKYTETWDGTSWTAGPDTNTAHYYGAGWGTTTSALIVGTNPANNVVEGFNGTSWSEVAEMGTNRVLHGGGTGGPGNTSGIIFGGNDGSLSNATEEWTAADFQIKTMTTS